jgi:predicted nucleic acid-binding protein
MTVVDTSVWIDFFNGVNNDTSRKLNTLLGQREVVIGDLILAEVLQGFRKHKDYQTARELFELVAVEEMVGASAAIRAADACHLLRRKGKTVRKAIDVMIAVHCIECGHSLLHNDRDFDQIAKVLPLRML